MQSIEFAPGRVARSILSGMLGISPHIRELHPTLAEQVRAGGPVHLPGGLSLWVAAYLGNQAQLTGPMLTGFAGGRAINTLAAVTFRPLAWALATSESDESLYTQGWARASKWLLYEDDRVSHDLRWLVPDGLSIVGAVLHGPSDEGIQMYSKEISPIMIGRLPARV